MTLLSDVFVTVAVNCWVSVAASADEPGETDMDIDGLDGSALLQHVMRKKRIAKRFWATKAFKTADCLLIAMMLSFAFLKAVFKISSWRNMTAEIKRVKRREMTWFK